jgi:hypothetical protein
MHVSFVWNYSGHNGGFYDSGPNWVQLTFPPSRKLHRCALILTRTREDRWMPHYTLTLTCRMALFASALILGFGFMLGRL